MKEIKLSMSTAQKLIDYLVTKPWIEVHDLITLIRQSITDEKEETS